MKHFIFLCICFLNLLPVRLHAQQNHFIYLQTENKQPFYVKLDNNILSSSVSGYLIIPKLTDGTYNLVLGFPKKEWSEQKFSCEVASKDAGYLVKNFGEKGWGLFNLQTLDITMSGTQNQPSVGKAEEKTDEFSTLLSSAVNDPSILKKDAPEPVVVKKDTLKPAVAEVKTEQVPAPANQVTEVKTQPTPSPITEVAEEKAKEVIAPKVVVKEQDEIKKIQETNGLLEITRTYLVRANGITDTVSISFPVEVEVKKPAPVAEAVKEKVAVAEPLPVAKTLEIVQVEKQPAKEKFLPIDMSAAPVKSDSVIGGTEKLSDKITPSTDTFQITEKSAVAVTNSDCINNATDDDFLKLRKKMASSSIDEDMMNIAKKAFKQRCFSTDQIKNLGVLFLKDDGRYNFFDLAYPHVWDSSNYKLLENQLADPYYANRFKAMIRH